MHGGRELVPEFYAVFARNMRDLGTPVYAQRFFATILEEFPVGRRDCRGPTGHDADCRVADLSLAHGAPRCPGPRRCASIATLSPNMLLYWTMLKRTIEAGSTVFDFGRSTPNESTYHFKTPVGRDAHAVPLGYWLASGGALPDQSPSNPKFQAAIEVWKRLPVPVTTWLGPHIIRSIP